MKKKIKLAMLILFIFLFTSCSSKNSGVENNLNGNVDEHGFIYDFDALQEHINKLENNNTIKLSFNEMRNSALDYSDDIINYCKNLLDGELTVNLPETLKKYYCIQKDNSVLFTNVVSYFYDYKAAIMAIVYADENSAVFNDCIIKEKINNNLYIAVKGDFTLSTPNFIKENLKLYYVTNSKVIADPPALDQNFISLKTSQKFNILKNIKDSKRILEDTYKSLYNKYSESNVYVDISEISNEALFGLNKKFISIQYFGDTGILSIRENLKAYETVSYFIIYCENIDDIKLETGYSDIIQYNDFYDIKEYADNIYVGIYYSDINDIIGEDEIFPMHYSGYSCDNLDVFEKWMNFEYDY